VTIAIVVVTILIAAWIIAQSRHFGD